MNSVDVTTGSRLHFGLLCGAPGAAWHYGGIGLMLEQPAWKLTVARTRRGQADQFITSAAAQERLQPLLEQFRQQHADFGTIQVTTHSEVDFHAGLGSGTQLTLALGTALLLLNGQPRPSSVTDVATALGRSRRSAVGTFGYDHGGFIVDYGRSRNDLQRLSFPEEWRMVLLTPTASEGLSGASEEAFFGERPFLPASTVHTFEQLITQQLIPALQAVDFPTFKHALAAYGALAGQDYAAAQGGVYSHRLIRQVTDQLADRGMTGAVQSSWGPTVAIPAASLSEAQHIQAAVSQLVPAAEMRVRICPARNTGATMKTAVPDTGRAWA